MDRFDSLKPSLSEAIFKLLLQNDYVPEALFCCWDCFRTTLTHLSAFYKFYVADENRWKIGFRRPLSHILCVVDPSGNQWIIIFHVRVPRSVVSWRHRAGFRGVGKSDRNVFKKDPPQQWGVVHCSQWHITMSTHALMSLLLLLLLLLLFVSLLLYKAGWRRYENSLLWFESLLLEIISR